MRCLIIQFFFNVCNIFKNEKLVVVQWDGKVSIEFVTHPKKDEFLMEGVKFFCPKCHYELTSPFDPIGNNQCSSCGQKLWINLETILIIQEPQEISEIAKELENNEYSIGQILNIKSFKRKRISSSSKFSSLERINWGASPGARKLMLGEYFIKMRLYRIGQHLVAQCLTLLRKSKNISIQDGLLKILKRTALKFQTVKASIKGKNPGD